VAELKPEIRRAILAGRRPQLIWPGNEPCPVRKGEQIGLVFLRSEYGPVPQVSITIVALRRGKKGEYIATYSIRDDRPLYLAPGSGYTSVRFLSPDPDVDVMDEGLHRRLHGEALAANAMKRTQRRARADRFRLEERLNEARRKHWASTVRYLERVQRHRERKSTSERAA
jgi:hypothetical protein